MRESTSRVKIFKNFKEHKSVRAGQAEGIFGGYTLAVKGQDCVNFFDWNEGVFLRKIDVVPRQVMWNETGTLVCLICDETSYVLKYDDSAVAAAIQGGNIPEVTLDFVMLLCNFVMHAVVFSFILFSVKICLSHVASLISLLTLGWY